MAAKGSRTIMWEVGCEGHTDAWVVADTWEEATVEAAKFWDVPWKSVASRCEQKTKIVGAPKNICCRCRKIYYGALPMCDLCKKAAKLEEEETARRIRASYRREYATG